MGVEPSHKFTLCMSSWNRIRHLFIDQRRRLASLFLVLGVLFLAQHLLSNWPREREVRYELDVDLQACEIARMDYLEGGESIGSVQLRFPAGAPPEVVHRPTLPAGRYDVSIELTFPNGTTQRAQRTLDVPVEGAMRVPLHADYFR